MQTTFGINEKIGFVKILNCKITGLEMRVIQFNLYRIIYARNLSQNVVYLMWSPLQQNIIKNLLFNEHQLDISLDFRANLIFYAMILYGMSQIYFEKLLYNKVLFLPIMIARFC